MPTSNDSDKKEVAVLLDSSINKIDIINAIEPISQLALNYEDFTIECWVYLTKVGGDNHHIIGVARHGCSDSDWTLGLSGGRLMFCLPASPFLESLFLKSDVVCELNRWIHVAVTRRCLEKSYWTIYKLFQDGVCVAKYWALDRKIKNNSPVSIGSDLSGRFALKGYVDEVRIVIGQSLYNEDFTPPNTEFDSYGTALLLHMNDNIPEYIANWEKDIDIYKIKEQNKIEEYKINEPKIIENYKITQENFIADYNITQENLINDQKIKKQENIKNVQITRQKDIDNFKLQEQQLIDKFKNDNQIILDNNRIRRQQELDAKKSQIPDTDLEALYIINQEQQFLDKIAQEQQERLDIQIKEKEQALDAKITEKQLSLDKDIREQTNQLESYIEKLQTRLTNEIKEKKRLLDLEIKKRQEELSDTINRKQQNLNNEIKRQYKLLNDFKLYNLDPNDYSKRLHNLKAEWSINPIQNNISMFVSPSENK